MEEVVLMQWKTNIETELTRFEDEGLGNEEWMMVMRLIIHEEEIIAVNIEQ